MAMLAEPRRKQKWSVDPRNSAWSKDESKFGQKMLEKMGWSKGKGLGAQEQGNTEHIRVQVKNNTLGLGLSINQEDNWIAHQDDFNQLLAELNNTHGQETPEAVSKEEKKIFSLEEKSKTSRKRVHYVKFAKGKDLSSRSEDDLSCIFGKRQIKKKQDDAADGNSSDEASKEELEPAEQVDAGNTVTSTLTVQEYFAKRMAKLKKAHRGPDHDPPPEMTEKLECLESQPRRKKKQKEAGLENAAGGAKAINPARLDSSGEEEDKLETQKEKKKRKKRKKSKQPSGDCSLTCDESQEEELCLREASDAEVEDLGEPQSKKKKTKKLGRDREGEGGRTKPSKKKRSS
ncbi:PIN2/TERF1-interacting telomerase inhibitor 1 [Anolis carolinensis]|uniref:G-patch domain-containing protein n=1 Tax=Anolis carolinensis TaxID=28377 RepID=A0A803SR79_ANOCA|nr:PREDICTED: PIN2/TERF1-interacting telomerase inhibitor 1 [Anolis carolinensis]|eukprot:XP_008119569.1 PREDICTED: PIN2/TERF1-interacting telomerase inhibitor 1 [Anolis carolinensis]